MTFIFNLCLIIEKASGHSAAWIAHLHGVQGVVSSNLTDPTSFFVMSQKKDSLLAYDAHFFAQDFTCIIGADEAGRGALAGPVIAGSIWLSRTFFEQYQA